MRKVSSTILAFIILAMIAGACGKKSSSKSSSSTATTTTAGKTYSFNAVNTAHLAQSFDANTPSGFKSTALRANLLDAASDLCHSQYGYGTNEDLACETMADIQARFFSQSPTNIHDRLADLDQTLNSALTSVNDSYVPCLDSTRTTATTYADFWAAGHKTSASATFAPFALTTVPLKSTFLDNISIDTGDTLKLSCFDFSNTSDTPSKGPGHGYGFDSATGTWYLYSLSSNHIGTFGSSDQYDNINMWFSIGDTSANSDSGQDAAEKASGTAIYGGSTGIVQIISKPSLGLVGLAQVGVGIGPGCGAQLLMNASTLYFRGNINGYGQCWDTDFNVTSTSHHTAGMDAVEVCMNVSGSSVTPTPDLTACEKSGLISRDDSGNIVSPFEAAGLKYLTANSNSGVSGAVAIRAWEGSFFMGDTDFSAIPPFGNVRLSKNDSVTVTGYSANSFAMNRTTAVADQSTSVSASCSATGAALTTTLTESFEITVPEIIAAQQALSASSTDTATTMVTDMNAAFTNTGDAAASITIPLTGTRGTSFYGAFAGTATVTLDGTTLGTATLTLPNASGTMSATGTIAMPAGTTVTATSKFNVQVAGTLTLTCSNTNATTRTVAAKAALPSLLWYVQNKPQTTTTATK